MRFFKEGIMEAVPVGSRNIIILMRQPPMPFGRYHVTIWTSHRKKVIKLNPSSLIVIFEYY